MENNMLSEIFSSTNKLKATLKELRESVVKWILVIPCWILDIQILLFQYFNPLKIRKNQNKYLELRT